MVKYKRILLKLSGEAFGQKGGKIDTGQVGQIVLELKKDGRFPKKNIEQVKGYLQAAKLKLAILVNFTPEGVKFLRVL